MTRPAPEDTVGYGGSDIQNRKPGKTADVRAMFLVDDISRYGGVRTRVAEELSCVVDSVTEEAYVISRCNLKNIEAIGSAVRTLKDDIHGKRMVGFSFPKLPHGGLPLLYELSFILNTALLGLLVIPLALVRRINIIYGHNNELGILAIIASKMLRIPSVVDLHGVEVDEYLEKYPDWNAHGARARFWRRVEGFILQNADTIVCVSSVHRREIEKRLGAERRIFIVPCFADEAVFDCGRHVKNDVRLCLGIPPGEMVFVYSGIVPVQYDEFNPIHFFTHLGDTQGKRLLVLAADSESIERAGRQISPSMKGRIIVVSVPRSRVPEYLCACDVGLLLRKASIVNYVASPTKFAEYLLCGLPVVITESLGDATSLVRRDNIGIVVSGINPVDSLSEEKSRTLLSNETKARARATGLANLSHESCRPLLLEVFEATLNAR